MAITKETLNLHFEERGTGTPILLIHGFPFSGRMWAGQLETLSKSARLLVPDLPGFGDSPAREGGVSVEQYAGDCFAILDALDIMEPVVIGFRPRVVDAEYQPLDRCATAGVRFRVIASAGRQKGSAGDGGARRRQQATPVDPPSSQVAPVVAVSRLPHDCLP